MRKSLIYLVLVIFLFSLVQVPVGLHIFPMAGAQPILIERGQNFERWSLGGGKYAWSSASQWVYNGLNWVPYIYSRDEAKKCYNVQVGFVAARIYDTGIVEIYDPSLSEIRVKGESWEIWSTGKEVTLNSPITWSVVTNSSGVFITRQQTTSKPDGVLVVNYIFLVGAGLKHTVKWTSTGASVVTVQVKQIHLMDFDKVVTDTGVSTASKSEKSVAYLFGYGSKDFWVLENQYAMVYDSTGTLLTSKCLQTGDIDFAGKKVTYTFGDWTLALSGVLEIDPDTATLNNPTRDGWCNNVGNGNDEYSLLMYYESTTPVWGRSFIEWPISSIPDGSSTITNILFKYEGLTKQRDCHIHAMTYQPSVSDYSTIFSDAGDGTVYVDEADFPVTGINKQIDLGSQADADLQYQLTHGDWFAIGIQLDFESGSTAYNYIASEEDAGTPLPTLYVEYTTNTAPVNGAGSITDMDDTNNVYAQRKLYTGSSVATDADGYANIHYMEFRIKQGATTRASFQYHEDDNTFNIQSGSTEWTLDVSSSASRAGTTITVTWKFAAQWDATEEAALEIELYVVDANAAADTDTAQTNYFDVIKTLTITGFASYPVEYVNPAYSVTFSGTVYYVNNPGSSTATTFYPPNAEFTAVHVHNAAHASKGNNASIVNGAFSLSFNSEAPVAQYTYHPYIAMADADYTDIDVSGVTDTITVININPTNDACDSTVTFLFEVDGWVNVTVSDANLVANLMTVDIKVDTTGDAQTFTLRWTQATGVFSEVSDISNICTLGGSSVRTNIDADTDTISFQFQFTGSPTEGACDVTATTTDDTTETDIDIYAFEFTLAINYNPIISSSSITDLDDTDNCYAMKTYYTFQTVITDLDGAIDIWKISVRGMQGVTVRWLVDVTGLNSTAVYTVTTGIDIIGLSAPGCGFSEAGDIGTLTLKIMFEWDYVYEDDCEIAVWAMDTSGLTVGWTTVQTNYFDVITRLVTSDFAADVSSTTVSTPFTISGKVRYSMTAAGYNASTSYPPDAQFTTIKIYTDDDVFVGQDTTITNGVFSVNATSVSVIGTTAYIAWLNLVPDYTDGYAIDGDVVYVATGAIFPFVDFLSNAFAFFGLAGAVTSTIYTTLFAFAAWFTNAATLMVSLITSVITLIFFVAGSVIYWLALFVNFFIGLFTIIGDVIDGTTPYTTGLGNIWNLIGFETWAAAVPLFAFIFWWDSMIKRNKQSGRGELEIIVGDLQIVSYIIGEVWNWIYTVFNFVLNVIGQIASRF